MAHHCQFRNSGCSLTPTSLTSICLLRTPPCPQSPSSSLFQHPSSPSYVDKIFFSYFALILKYFIESSGPVSLAEKLPENKENKENKVNKENKEGVPLLPKSHPPKRFGTLRANQQKLSAKTTLGSPSTLRFVLISNSVSSNLFRKFADGRLLKNTLYPFLLLLRRCSVI